MGSQSQVSLPVHLFGADAKLHLVGSGFFRETSSDAVMEKVDLQGNVIGFSILKVSAL